MRCCWEGSEKMLKKGLSLLLVAVMLVSLSGCSDLFGSAFFLFLAATSDDSADKDDIFEFVCENEEELLEAIENGNFSVYENQEFLKDITVEGTLSWVVKNGDVMGAIVFRDVLRSDANETIEKLRTVGVNTIAVLTGDNKAEAERVMSEANIDIMHAELLPEQKLEKVKEAQKNHLVAVVGDGINDSLALSEADVGIAMGAMGSDTAIQSADISLMNNSLDNLPFVIELSRKTKATIYQNIIIAFSISFIMMVLAATGLVTPIVGAFLHNIGAFIILINSGKITKKK
jgi:P-type E1-E2 ATPase